LLSSFSSPLSYFIHFFVFFLLTFFFFSFFSSSFFFSFFFSFFLLFFSSPFFFSKRNEGLPIRGSDVHTPLFGQREVPRREDERESPEIKVVNM